MTTAPTTHDCNETVNAVGIRCSALLGADCGVLTPDSQVPHLRKYAGRKMSEVPKWFWQFMWDKAGYGGFGERRGWQGRIADYLEAHCGFRQEPRPVWAYEAPNK